MHRVLCKYEACLHAYVVVVVLSSHKKYIKTLKEGEGACFWWLFGEKKKLVSVSFPPVNLSYFILHLSVVEFGSDSTGEAEGIRWQLLTKCLGAIK